MEGVVIWALSPDHFALAWATTGHDTFPPPLRVQPTARTVDECRAQQLALDTWWRGTSTRSDFEVALRVLADPTLRIEVFAVVDEPVRVLGAAAGDHAVVVRQDPGSDPAFGSTIHLRSTPSAELAAAVVDALPNRSPGTQPAATAAAGELLADRPTSVMYDPYRIPNARRLRRILAAPRDGTGHVMVTAAGAGSPPQVLSWVDPVGDGRYLVRAGTDVDCLPATNEEFVAHLNRLVDAATSRITSM